MKARCGSLHPWRAPLTKVSVVRRKKKVKVAFYMNYAAEAYVDGLEGEEQGGQGRRPFGGEPPAKEVEQKGRQRPRIV
ncbi:TPA: hypothetical protein EYP44_04270 [Candidatus Bathyarchaeota archaeon]|nr:hypothetical protein [Candidatus Bathyarchaeota archaeon]